MFRAILYTQWKWTRLALLPCVIIAFALPIVSVSRLGTGLDQGAAGFLLYRMIIFSVWYPVLAAAAGLIVAVSAWREDHRGSHVYALSLPVSRARFALLRYAAGALLLALPLVALWSSALIAAGLTSIPYGLRAYPNALALRFALAAFVAYSLFFAISAGTTRTAGWVLGTIGGTAALAVLLVAAGLDLGEFDVIAWLFTRLISATGPLAVFTGPWVLIDV